MRIMAHNILLTREIGRQTMLHTEGGVPKDPVCSCYVQEKEGRMTPTMPPFVRPGSFYVPTFCQMLCGPSVFYHI